MLDLGAVGPGPRTAGLVARRSLRDFWRFFNDAWKIGAPETTMGGDTIFLKIDGELRR